jgi:hypothetical protein
LKNSSICSRQREQQGAIHELEFVGETGKPRVAPRSLIFCHQIEENAFEQLGIEHSLRLGKTAKTHRPCADLVLNSLQMACCAKASHGIEHRIEHAEQF